MNEDEIRQRFESWISSEPFCEPVERYGPDDPWPGSYISLKAHVAWDAWLEAWQQAPAEQSVESE